MVSWAYRWVNIIYWTIFPASYQKYPTIEVEVWYGCLQPGSKPVIHWSGYNQSVSQSKLRERGGKHYIPIKFKLHCSFILFNNHVHTKTWIPGRDDIPTQMSSYSYSSWCCPLKFTRNPNKSPNTETGLLLGHNNHYVCNALDQF